MQSSPRIVATAATTGGRHPCSAAMAPIQQSNRIDAMDILRGFALIGILLMNIEWFNRPLVELGRLDQGLGWWRLGCQLAGQSLR